MTPDEQKQKVIFDKIKAGQKLTYEEDMYYFTVILNFTEAEAKGIIAINNNPDKYTIID